MIAAPRMYWTPTEWWVQPTEYTQAVVRSRPLLAVTASQTFRNCSDRTTQASCTISGV